MRNLILILFLGLSGCTTTTIVRRWTPPEGAAGLREDSPKCELVARAYAPAQQQRVFDICMQQVGYKLEIVEVEE